MTALAIDELDGPKTGKGASAAQQGSMIPRGWIPTPDKPVPVVRCSMIKKDGERCKKWSLRGTTVCVKHGASLPSVREFADAVVESTRLRILDNADMAVDVLEDLMQVGTSENVRLKAATETLDRAGIRGGMEINHTAEVSISPADLLTERLVTLRKRSDDARERLGEVFDAEVVESVQQLTLFE